MNNTKTVKIEEWLVKKYLRKYVLGFSKMNHRILKSDCTIYNVDYDRIIEKLEDAATECR